MNNETNRNVYLDNSATTRPYDFVIDLMVKIMAADYGNPSSLHRMGLAAEEYVKTARGQVAQALGASPEEIFFTSGGSESDNTAIFGAAYKGRRRGKKVLTSAVEHPAVLEAYARLAEEGFETVLLPDEPDMLKKELCRLADQRQADLVITSGGTGFSPRDRTPEATLAAADRNAPGIAEYIRMRSMEITDRAMLSRGVSVIRKNTLIINLPGSPKAVQESLGFILDGLSHGLKVLRNSVSECGRA